MLMNRSLSLRLCVLLALVAGGALVSAQVQLPSAPLKQFGASISPAYEGWFDNPDGTHNFLIGYYNRNTDAEVDVPIGPNNHFEPGNADMGQPTHFLTRRRFGMFVVTMPKEFGKTQRISWTLNVNGQSITIPFHMHTDYNVTPLKSSEESPDGSFNLPPVLRLAQNGPSLVGPAATVAKATSRTATVGVPMALDLWADDDARYSSGGNGPMTNPAPPVNATISKYRGPGEIKIVETRPKFEALKGGKPAEPYSGKASTTVTFSEPGDYMLHVTVNDYSGNGGGGSGCCWTNAIVKVAVAAASTNRGQ
jgi:hypothetical protein